MPKKLKGGTLWDFSTSILSQNMKKLKKIFFSGKNLTMPKKTERRNPLGFSNIHSVAKHQKNAGGPFEEKKFRKKRKKNVSQCRKKLKGETLWSRPVWYVTRKNR